MLISFFPKCSTKQLKEFAYKLLQPNPSSSFFYEHANFCSPTLLHPISMPPTYLLYFLVVPNEPQTRTKLSSTKKPPMSNGLRYDLSILLPLQKDCIYLLDKKKYLLSNKSLVGAVPLKAAQAKRKRKRKKSLRGALFSNEKGNLSNLPHQGDCKNF